MNKTDFGLIAGLDNGYGTTVLSPGSFIVAENGRSFLTIRNGGNSVGGNTLRNQIVSDGAGTTFTQSQVVFSGTSFVAVTLNDDINIFVFFQPVNLSTQNFFGIVAQRRAVKREDGSLVLDINLRNE